jgi:hypothetical protein
MHVKSVGPAAYQPVPCERPDRGIQDERVGKGHELPCSFLGVAGTIWIFLVWPVYQDWRVAEYQLGHGFCGEQRKCSSKSVRGRVGASLIQAGPDRGRESLRVPCGSPMVEQLGRITA